MKTNVKILLLSALLQFNLVKTLPAQPPPFINYQGFLTDVFTGNPSDTTVSMNFAIYDAETGGTSLWSESQTVSVENGYFSVLLGQTNPINPQIFFLTGQRYLGVQVGNNDEMTPRRMITSSAYSQVSGLAFLAQEAAKLGGKEASEYITSTTTQTSGEPVLSLRNEGSGRALQAVSISSGSAGYFSNADFGNTDPALEVATNADGKAGYFHIDYNLSFPNSTSPALEGRTNGDGPGVLGRSEGGDGLQGYGIRGLYAEGSTQAVHGKGTGGFGSGVLGEASGLGIGVQAKSDANVALYIQSNSFDLIQGYGEGDGSDLDFRVMNDGSAFADGGWQGAADFAELIEFDGHAASFEPGDVLVISTEKNRAVALSTQPYSTAVIGVYSTKAGFIGSIHPMESRTGNEIPVAITGIVPCKVSCENGPIQRGDLLTTATTPGHAMKATDPRIGTILGKAMQPLSSGIGKIEILVSLH